MSTTISDFVDYRLRVLEDEHMPQGEVHQLTLRIPRDLVARLDTVAQFLSISRTAFITEALYVASGDAIQRLDENPIFSGLKVNELGPREFLKAKLAGDSQAPDHHCFEDADDIEETKTSLRAVS
jgi:predicted transcriptional regulator